MKKILATVMVLIMVVSMTACGSSKEKADPSTPTGGATVFLDALKAKDKDKLKDSYAGDSKQLLSAMGDMGASSSANKTEKELVKKMEEKIYDFDYEIKKEKIKDKKATVKLEITTYPFGKAIKDFMTEFSKLFKDGLQGELFEKATTKATKKLISKIDKMKKDFSKTVDLSLSKKGKKWVVDSVENNNDFADAMTGGMMSAIMPN